MAQSGLYLVLYLPLQAAHALLRRQGQVQSEVQTRMGQVQSEVAAAVDQGEQISSAAPPDPQAAPASTATSTASSMESLIAGTSLYPPALCLYLCVYLYMPTSLCCDLWNILIV